MYKTLKNQIEEERSLQADRKDEKENKDDILTKEEKYIQRRLTRNMDFLMK